VSSPFAVTYIVVSPFLTFEVRRDVPNYGYVRDRTIGNRRVSNSNRLLEVGSYMEAIVIMKILKPFRYSSVSLMSASLLLFTLACGGDSDDDDDNATGGTTTEETGGSGGTSETGSGGTTTNETGGSSGGAMDDAGQLDGGKPLPQDVAEGGECTLESLLFKATGTCSSSKECPGGLPTQFDISGIGINPEVASVLETPESDQANCASGLTCCVNTDQCNAVYEQLSSNTMVQGVLGDSISNLSIECVDTGSCAAKSEDNDFGEIPTGCETGQSCCVNVPKITLPDADLIPADGAAATDAGTQTADASPES